MSSSNNIITDDYTQKCYKIALKYPKKVLGFITQKRFIEDSNFLFLTPGVKIVMENVLDQNYRTPKQAIEEDGNDIIIVGSGIYNSKKGNIEDIIEKYKFI
jgi:orotidine-5'-phosphate decarboxylase